MSRNTSSACSPLKKAGLGPPAPSNLSISTTTSATRPSFTTNRSRVSRSRREKPTVPRRVELCRRPSEAFPPLRAPPSPSLQPPPPSPDPASDFNSSIFTDDTLSGSSAVKGSTASSTLPTDVESASGQTPTSPLASASPPQPPRPAYHPPLKVHVIRIPRDPRKDLIQYTEIGGVRQRSLPSLPVPTSRSSSPKVDASHSSHIKRTRSTKPNMIIISQSQHPYPSLRPIIGARSHVSGPTSVVTSPRRKDHHTRASLQKATLPYDIHTPPTTTVQTAAAHPQPPPRQSLLSHRSHGQVAAVPLKQSTQLASRKIAGSGPKHPASGADLTSPAKKRIDLPTIVPKPTPPAQKMPSEGVVQRLFHWLS